MNRVIKKVLPKIGQTDQPLNVIAELTETVVFTKDGDDVDLVSRKQDFKIINTELLE